MSNRKKQKTNIFGSLLVGFLVVLVIYLYFLNTKAKASWFDDAWRYRVAVPISAHTTAETNVYITLSGSDGINTTDTTKFQTDCGDIRFVNEAGDLLPYYLTTACGLAQTGFQVYFESFPAGAQTIYYYYGNPSVPNGFSGASMGAAATGVTLGTRGSETEAPSSPMVYFRLDEGVGQTVANSMETVNNGTLGPDATVTATDPTWRSAELCMVGKCLEFESTSSQYVNVANTIASVNSVSFWVKPTSTTTSLMVLNGAAGNASISVSSGTISAGAGFTSPTIYVNGVVKSTLVANEWQYVTVTTATGISASNIMIGRVNTGYLDGFIDEVKLFGSTLSVSQIKAGYASGLARSSSVKNLSASFGGGSAAGTLANGLVGYWKMDETATPAVDSSGNGNNGTWTNTPTTTTGKYGNGVYFDVATTNKYITVPAATSINDLSQFTWSTWVNPSQLQNGTRVMSKAGVLSLTLQNVSSSTRMYFNITCSGTDMQIQTTSSDVLPLNTWSHVVVVWDGTSCLTESANIYINGKVTEKHASSTNGSGTKDVDSGGPLTIGNNWASYASQIQGSLDDIRIYNRVLNTEEIKRLYNYSPSPVAYWNFNENSGQTLTYGLSGASTLGSDATITSDDPFWASGKYGGGLGFDGVDDKVRTDDSNVFSFGNGTADTAYTMETWVYMENGYGTSRYFIDKSSEWVIRVGSDGRLICSQEDSSTGGNIGRNWSGPVQTGVWFHVACTYDGSRTSAGTKIYVNGVRVDNANEQSGTYVAMENTTNSMRFSDTEYLRGKMDEIKFYNYERTPAQIVEDLAGGLNMPLVHYSFDDANGDVVGDSGVLRSNGDLSGSTTCPSATICPKWHASGKIGGATYFESLQTANGDSHIRMQNDLLDGMTEGAISFWFKTEDFGTDNDIFGASEDDNGSGSDFVGLLYDSSTDVLNLGIANNGSFVLNAVTETIANPTQWHHAVVNMGSWGNEMYVDGRKHNLTYLTGTSTTSVWFDDISENTTSYTIGCTDFDGSDNNDCTGNGFYIGYLDDFKLFASPLTFEQIKAEYAAGSASVNLGSGNISSVGVSDNSQAKLYCVPGDATSCSAPILHLKLDEGGGTSVVYDSSGNSRNGTLSGVDNSDWVAGKYGSGIDFDNANDYVSIADDNVFSVNNTNQLTVEAWFKLDNATLTQEIVSKGNTSNFEWAIRVNSDGTIYGYLYQSGGGDYMVTPFSSTLTTNTWYHVAMVANTSTPSLKLYLNGVQIAEDTTTAGSYTNGTAAVRIGERVDGTRDVDGVVDDVRIYDYARTAAQVAWGYNNGRPMGQFKFDECQGSVLYDSENSANTAAITIGATGTQTAVGTCAVNATTARYTGREGKINSALNFDGTDDYAIRTGSALPTGDLSVSAWVYRNATGNAHTIVKASEGTGTNELKFAITADDDGTNTNKLRFTVDGTSTYSQTALSLANTWYHVVGVRSGSTVRMYINGKLDPVTGSDGTALNFSSCNLYIGGSPSSGCSASLIEFFDGKIDDLRIYNYALNATQVKNIMNESAIRVGPVTGSPN